MSSIDFFYNILSAGIYGTEVEDYVQAHEAALTKLDELEGLVPKVSIRTIDGYKKGMAIKSILSSLACYTFNNRKPENDRVWALEGKLGAKLGKFAKAYGSAPKTLRPLVRYLLWTRHYTCEDTEKIARALLHGGLLWKDGEGNYLVTGLSLAVGDNVVTVGDRGNKWRQYAKVCTVQAFHVSGEWQEKLKALESEKSITIPLLDETIYRKTSVGDGKYCAKISMYRDSKELIINNYLR